MGRALGIDYGTKRVGVAETDDLQIIASPLTTVHSSEIVGFIEDYKSKHDLEVLVVGEPKRLDASDTDSTYLVREFVTHLGRKFPDVKIEMIDERFTSKLAMQSLVQGGVSKKKRREKGTVDMVSAAIILQSYLEKKSSGF